MTVARKHTYNEYILSNNHFDLVLEVFKHVHNPSFSIYSIYTTAHNENTI